MFVYTEACIASTLSIPTSFRFVQNVYGAYTMHPNFTLTLYALKYTCDVSLLLKQSIVFLSLWSTLKWACVGQWLSVVYALHHV